MRNNNRYQRNRLVKVNVRKQIVRRIGELSFKWDNPRVYAYHHPLLELQEWIDKRVRYELSGTYGLNVPKWFKKPLERQHRRYVNQIIREMTKEGIDFDDYKEIPKHPISAAGQWWYEF